jgi:hypothetical protein
MNFESLTAALAATVLTDESRRWFFRESRYARFIDSSADVTKWAYAGNVIICQPSADVVDIALPYLIVIDEWHDHQIEYLPNL